VRWQGGDHGFGEEVVPAGVWVLLAGGVGVLEGDGEMQRPVAHPACELCCAAFGDADLQVGRCCKQGRDGGRDDRGQHAGECAYAQLTALGGDFLGDLSVREGEAVGDRAGVFEQLFAGCRESQAARAAVQQPRPELALERGHLLGDGGLSERQVFGGARERALASDLAEGQQAPRIHRH
jgi:hypothetical protein